jgi:putative ABC transport system permease protein
MRMLREVMLRLAGALRPGRQDRDLEEELRLHEELAVEDARRRGVDRRAAMIRTGTRSSAMDALRDQRGLPRLEALAADVVFGWRQLNKHRGVTAAAVLSLGLAIGATTAAFRLVDAVLLRPLPVRAPDQLFSVATTFVDSSNRPDTNEVFDYPTYQRYAKAVGHLADMMVIGTSVRMDVTVGSAEETERVYRQYLSGNVFPSLGLQPAAGRLFGPDDDRLPGAHQITVISHDYWTRRFARDPGVIGTTIRIGSRQFEVIGVAAKGFTGTEPGRLTDLFIPATINAQALNDRGWVWFRMWVRPRAAAGVERIRHTLQAVFDDDKQAWLPKLPADMPKAQIDAFLNERVLLLPAAAGTSAVQKTFRRPLFILAGLVALVLLIACANVANLLIGQGLVRVREMALRVSIGAGRGRLVQMLLVESVLVALLASAAGMLFAWWSAPFVVSMLATPQDPVRLVLDPDWRLLAFGAGLTLVVACLFGLVPALRASAVAPLRALKGSDDPQAHRRLTKSLIAAQMAFCVFVLFVAVLFVATFARLAKRPLGFSHERVLVMDVESRSGAGPGDWTDVVDRVGQAAGVESAAFCGWTMLSENRWYSSVRVPGQPFDPVAPYFVEVGPGFFGTLQIGVLHGRDFRAGDLPPALDRAQRPRAGVGIVNEAFARQYFAAANPVGRTVSVRQTKEVEAPLEIVGQVRDTTYFSVRETMRPMVFVPVESRSNGTLVVRTAGDPLTFAPALRREVDLARSGVRVRIQPHSALVERQLIRERLLATLSLFFAGLGLVLSGIGLYGVLNHAVIRQRREIGVRMALGARAAHVVRRVTTNMLWMVAAGGLVGLAGGFAFSRVVESLLFGVSATDPGTVLTTILALTAASALAALPPAIRAARIDPAETLRTD